jgi:ribosomal protein S18 acetylase RimI-like enzyme
VRNAGVQGAFCEISAQCFHVPLTWFREVFDSPAVWDQFAAYVGYADGRPVATAATVLGAGAVGVYNVATLPEARRRGYGEAVMRHALADARRLHGLQRSVLQSTPAGHRIYERMGYRTVTSVSVWAS